jgi:hypothetical protein
VVGEAESKKMRGRELESVRKRGRKNERTEIDILKVIVNKSFQSLGNYMCFSHILIFFFVLGHSRNASVTCISPTGSISIIAGVKKWRTVGGGEEEMGE